MAKPKPPARPQLRAGDVVVQRQSGEHVEGEIIAIVADGRYKVRWLTGLAYRDRIAPPSPSTRFTRRPEDSLARLTLVIGELPSDHLFDCSRPESLGGSGMQRPDGRKTVPPARSSDDGALCRPPPGAYCGG